MPSNTSYSLGSSSEHRHDQGRQAGPSLWIARLMGIGDVAHFSSFHLEFHTYIKLRMSCLENSVLAPSCILYDNELLLFLWVQLLSQEHHHSSLVTFSPRRPVQVIYKEKSKELASFRYSFSLSLFSRKEKLWNPKTLWHVGWLCFYLAVFFFVSPSSSSFLHVFLEKLEFSHLLVRVDNSASAVLDQQIPSK